MNKSLSIAALSVSLLSCASMNACASSQITNYSCDKVIVPTNGMQAICAVGDLEFYYDGSVDDVAVKSADNKTYNVRYWMYGLFYNDTYAHDGASSCAYGSSFSHCLNPLVPYPQESDGGLMPESYFVWTQDYFYFSPDNSYNKPNYSLLVSEVGNIEVPNFYFENTTTPNMTYAITGNFSASRFGSDNCVIEFNLAAKLLTYDTK